MSVGRCVRTTSESCRGIGSPSTCRLTTLLGAGLPTDTNRRRCTETLEAGIAPGLSTFLRDVVVSVSIGAVLETAEAPAPAEGRFRADLIRELNVPAVRVVSLRGIGGSHFVTREHQGRAQALADVAG